jgi:hypothetical protein
MIRLPYLNTMPVNTDVVPVMTGSIVDDEEGCVLFGASWNYIPLSKTYVREEKQIRNAVVGEYF